MNDRPIRAHQSFADEAPLDPPLSDAVRAVLAEPIPEHAVERVAQRAQRVISVATQDAHRTRRLLARVLIPAGLAVVLTAIVWAALKTGEQSAVVATHEQGNVPKPAGAKTAGSSHPEVEDPVPSPVVAHTFFSPFDFAFVHTKWGFLDKTGRAVVEPKYTNADDFSEGLAAVKVGGTHVLGGKWGYIDTSGRMVIEPRFDRVGPFSEGLAAVAVDGRWGFVDLANRLAIPAQFVSAGRFSEGLAPVCVGHRYRFGFVDATGQMRIEPQFLEAGRFSEGLALVRLGDKWSYIDRSGKPAFPAEFESAHSFSQGRAAVRLGAKWGYIDRGGRHVVPPQFDSAQPFTAGRARVVTNVRIEAARERGMQLDQFSYLDPSGKPLGPPKFAYVYGVIYLADQNAVVGRTVNLDGESVSDSPIDFDRVWNTSNGLFHVRTSSDMRAKHGFIDRAGKLVIKPELEWAKDFHQGFARFAVGVNWEAAEKAMRQPPDGGRRSPSRQPATD